jgi:large subunit ribosomal protein L35
MPKMKTNKSAKRRFTVTGTGKIMRAIGPKGHFRRRKAKRTLRSLDKKMEVHGSDLKRVRRSLPYGVK